MDFTKYKKFPSIELADREWPGKSLDTAPLWCSVDLRDGNQSLPIPMNIEEKVEMFSLLVKMGFKEIEVGFPSASETEFNFLRKLIDEKLIPDDVTVQILTQAREHLIRRSFEALNGVKKAIVHFYNSTSTVQRRDVFKKGKDEIKQIAVDGAKLIKSIAADFDGEIRYEYSPESFTGTELDFAVEICEAVMDVMEPTPDNKLILNLPATVEMSTPNVHADQIEWFCKNIKNRESVIISLHTHNDRGTGVAASELGLLAGADRIEGTLFGNGERTGNADLITLGMNFYSQGIDPKIDFSNINEVIEVYTRCTRMIVPPRHPWAGNLVYTAFSGSHQDAIKKGLEVYRETEGKWEVPYLPIDPADLNRIYEEIIRINSQSGKGGVAFVLENTFGYKLPKRMHPEFSKIIQVLTDSSGDELTAEAIFDVFKSEYLDIKQPYQLKEYNILNRSNQEVQVDVVVDIDDKAHSISGRGNGPIDAFVNALQSTLVPEFSFSDYSEHALSSGSDSKAVAYIPIEDEKNNRYYGVGVDADINVASLKALLCALNRKIKKESEI